MQADIQEIVDHIEATVVTETDWSTILEGLTQRQVGILLPTLRMLKKQGKFWRRVVMVDGRGQVSVVRGRHPNLPASEE